MASVTFLATVGGDGSTVSDDTNPTTGLDADGHRTRLVPAFAQVVAVAANVVQNAQAALNAYISAWNWALTAQGWADVAAGYAAQAGATTSGPDPSQSPRNYGLGSMAYVNQTWLYASATYDPPSVAAAGSTTTTVTVPGAEMGDFVRASRSADSALMVDGRVSAAGTVTLTYFNPTAGAIDQTSHTVYVAVMKRVPQ